MHVRAVVIGALELFALAMGGCVDDLEDRTETLARDLADDNAGGDDDPCDDIADEADCLGAGCRWQPIIGAMIEDDDSCSFGEPLGLCFAPSLAQPCEPEARRCDDGRFAWVLPGPDDAMLLAYSDSSCGVPEHFMPCPVSTRPDDLRADVETPPPPTDDLEQVARSACACACEDDA
jgi:hypothetical protein